MGLAWVLPSYGCSSRGAGTGAGDAGADASVGGAGDGGPLPETPPRTLAGVLGARADVIVASLTSGDAEFLRARPGLAAGKYAIMAEDAFAFFRGALALFLHDWDDPAQGLQTTRFAADGAQPLGLGDPHPENFGTMRTRAGIFRLEPNDFDTADRLPYLWDLRRFAVSMCVAARVSNASDPGARVATGAAAMSIARAAVTSYADTVSALAAGGARPAIEDGGGNAILEDLFLRAAADWGNRIELDQSGSNTFPRLFRGAPDPAQPTETTRDLPARSRLELSASLAGYRPTLFPPPATTFVPLDAVQLFGRGIGSFPRVRAIVLTRGPTTGDKDDVLLEVKELPPSGSLPLPLPTAFASPGERVLAVMAAGWTERAADPLWGVGAWEGFPVQIRTESAGFKTIRVARWGGMLGTPAAVEGLGVALARLIARMHAAPVAGASPAVAISASIAADPGGFVDEQANLALGYCDQVMSDWGLFKQALPILGPTLGVTGDPARAPSADLRVLFDPGADPRAAGIDPLMGPVTINEISATGSEYVELLNGSDRPQSLAGYGVADADVDGGPRLDQAMRFFPGAMLEAGARMLVLGGFAVPAQGPQSSCIAGAPVCYQAAWHLSASQGEAVYLLTPNDVIADQATYPASGVLYGQSWGRSPDGAGPFAAGAASPNAANPSR
jgi:uncharacterized protein (DUF2252 family)